MKLGKSDLQLESIVSRIDAGELDLQPDFQRGEIWDLKRRQRLIDTILREWYVPAIHIVVNSDKEEVVLDGQQRLAAVRDFFANKFRIDGKISPEDESIQALDGLKYSQLPDPIRRALNRFVLPIITLSEYGPQEPNELFFRLNQSYNLSPPEKRNALHGKARDQVKLLVEDLTAVGLLKISAVGFNNGRLAYDDIIARTCVAIEKADLRQHINNNVVEEFYRAQPFSETTVESVRNSGRELLKQIIASEARIKFNKGTLQSWLVYGYWAGRQPGGIPEGLLARFEQERAAAKRGERPAPRPGDQALTAVLRLYDDRASYRVTDVSSVLIRDLAIQLFAESVFSVQPHLGSDRLLSALEHEPSTAQTQFSAFLEAASWGQLPKVEPSES